MSDLIHFVKEHEDDYFLDYQSDVVPRINELVYFRKNCSVVSAWTVVDVIHVFENHDSFSVQAFISVILRETMREEKGDDGG